jgi:predicted RNA polymerase sigma factor
LKEIRKIEPVPLDEQDRKSWDATLIAGAHLPVRRRREIRATYADLKKRHAVKSLSMRNGMQSQCKSF